MRDLFSFFNITQIPRAANEVVDKLAQIASCIKEAPLLMLVVKRIIKVLAIGVEVDHLGLSNAYPGLRPPDKTSHL